MEISENPDIDSFGTLTVGVVGEEIVKVTPMIYNDRITIGPLEDHELFYDHGWCYDKGHWLPALLQWDPLTQDEPPDYKKRATPGQRRAPGKVAS